eukprot:TRINITY_DN1479_c1_g1_i3.p2 TRINITY_DN1479_c1_g1~~TRINITY_DN1479_c1_g1_i3.p2  ORF type:complete len:303 (-),score=57.26 TRINITY_DN1479_c1_g1_i3:294-1202(-)
MPIGFQPMLRNVPPCRRSAGRIRFFGLMKKVRRGPFLATDPLQDSKKVNSRKGDKEKLVFCPCPGGGNMLQPVSSRSKEGRVDHNSKGNEGLIRIKGCPARTVFIPSMDVLVPRWCVTYKSGKNGRLVQNPSMDIFDYVPMSRNVCYGRLWYSDVVITVVTRAEPHNLQVVHPTQPRVMNVRELARCQGFPDHHVMAFDEMQDGIQDIEQIRSCSLNKRYLQVGNAVAPLQAAYLGQCLIKAIHGEVEEEEYIVRVVHPPYEDLVKEGRKRGYKFWDEVRQDTLEGSGVQGMEIDEEADEED